MPITVLILAFIVPLLAISFFLIKADTWKVLFIGLGITSYEMILAISAIIEGERKGILELSFTGQFVLVFSSVIGSILIGSAWLELRKKHFIKNAH